MVNWENVIYDLIKSIYLCVYACIFSACPIGTYGKSCQSTCRCLNGATCDPISGACLCTPGWIGSDCGRPCPDGFYGNDCQMTCQCSSINGATCSHQTGECLQCPPGRTGPNCTEMCPPGTWGHSCQVRIAIHAL
jgi:Laminin EGF domain